jgi:hypothetical protein
MLDKRIIHRSAAEGSEDGKGLRGDLLGDHNSEARRDLADELEKDGSAFVDDAAFGDEPGDFRHGLCDHASDGEISALGSVRRSGAAAQREDLHACESRFRIGQVFALAACDVVPPTAPDTVASARCSICECVQGDAGSVRSATLSAASSPFEVADAIAWEATDGKA